MNTLKFETKYNLNSKTVALLLIAVIFSSYFLHFGYMNYKKSMKSCSDFDMLEKKRSEKSFNSINTGIYGIHTFNFMLRPSLLLCLFNSNAPYDTLTCMIDNSGAVLKISDQVGNSSTGQSKSIDYAGCVLILFTLLGLLLGFSSMRYEERLRFVNNFSKPFSTLLQYNLAGAIYILAAVTLLGAVLFTQLGIYGIILTEADVNKILLFLLVTGLNMLLFYQVGSLVGNLKPGFSTTSSMFIFWAILVFILPFIIQSNKMNSPSQFGHEYEKYKKVLNSENSHSKEINKIKNLNDKLKYFREISIQYPERVLKQIERLENGYIADSDSSVKRDQYDNNFIPTNFYISMCREFSSMGGLAKIDFHKYTFSQQKYIVNNYFKRIPIKNLDFVYESESRFPHYFLTGFLVMVLYVFVFFIASYIVYKRRLFPHIKPGFEEVKIEAQKGDHVYSQVGIGYEDFSKEIYNCCFSGKKFTGSITVNGKSIFDLKIFYLPNLSGMSLKDLRILSGGKLPQGIENKSFSELSFQDLKGLFPQIAESDVLILDNTKLRIKPAGDIVILEMSPEEPGRIFPRFYLAVLEANRYRIKLQNRAAGKKE